MAKRHAYIKGKNVKWKNQKRISQRKEAIKIRLAISNKDISEEEGRTLLENLRRKYSN